MLSKFGKGRHTSNASPAFALALAVAAAIASGSASAQSTTDTARASDSSGLEEVLITSRRKVEKLQDVPISVSALNADQLETRSIIDQVTLSNFTPGYHFSDYTNGRSDRGAYRGMVFRGITSSSNTAVTASALTFLDGAPVIFNDILFTDAIERVEVLKGPQNVYFGRSTFTGAVNLITRNPGDTFGATTSFEAGNFNYKKFDGHVEGPLVANKLTGSFDVQFGSRDGMYRNTASPSEFLGARNSKSAAATLYYTPTDKLSVKFYASFFQYDDGPSASAVIPSSFVLNCNPGGTGGTGNFFPCGTIPKLQPNWVAQTNNFTAIENQQLNHPPGYNPLYDNCEHLGLCADTGGVHAVTNYELPWSGIKFQNITAYHSKTGAILANAVDQNVNAFANPNFGNPAFPLAPANSPTFDYNIIDKIWDFSTEFRLSSAEEQALRWTFGTNYVETNNQTDLWFYTSPTGVIPPNTLVTKTANYAKAIGFFGGLYYDPIENVTLSAELRRQSDKRQNVIAATGQVLSETFDSWSPRVSVQYRFTPDVNVYASYAAGVRPGGFNAIIFGLPAALKAQIAAQVGTAPTAIDEEKLWTGEIGLKGSFFERTVDTNIAVYYGKLTQQQVAQTAILLTPDPVFGGRFDLVTNNGNVDISGIEADVRWKLSRVVTLTGTVGYNKTEEHIANCFSCKLITGSAVLDGQRLNDSPETSATVSLDATDALTASSDWFLHLDYVYRGSVYTQQNGLNLSETGAANLVNAQVGINSGGYAFALWATNLTDDKTYTGAQLSADFLTGSPYGLRVGLPDRRAFGLRVKYEFK